MFTSRPSGHVAFALCCVALIACGRQDQPAGAGNARAAAPEQTAGLSAPVSAPVAGAPAAGALPPPTSELQPRPQSVAIGNPPPPPATEADRERDLQARERRLEARQAALEAREQKLRRQPQAAAATAGALSPAPAPANNAGGGDAVPATPDQQAAGGGAAAPFGPQADGGTGAPGDAAAPALVAGAGAGTAGAQPAGGQGAALSAGAGADDRAQGPATVPAGTRFEVEFTKSLASNTSSSGDTFRTRLLADVRLDDGVAIPAGSEILGVVTDAVGARRIGGKARLSLKFTDLILPSGATVPIQASFLEEGKGKAGRDAATIGGGAAGGALLGRLLGQSRGGTILGALFGAAVGTVIASKTAGEEVVIPEGSVVKLKLDQPLELKTRR
jgi:hypothetical protein